MSDTLEALNVWGLVCAVCSRPLNHHVGPNGEDRGWAHCLPSEDDHIPVPVEPTMLASLATRCDFCSADEVTHALPVARFDSERVATDDDGNVSAVSVGEWAACGVCATLIGRDEWSALVRRVCAKLRTRGDAAGIDTSGWETRVGRTYRELRRNITGSLREVAPAAGTR